MAREPGVHEIGAGNEVRVRTTEVYLNMCVCVCICLCPLFGGSTVFLCI